VPAPPIPRLERDRDPGMWLYLVDPELLALVVIVGIKQARWQVEAVWWRYRAWGSFLLRLGRPAEGGGTIGPMSPSGASSRSTITGA